MEGEIASRSQDIIAKALETACTYLNLIEAISVYMAEIDVFCSMAQMVVGSVGVYTRPRLLAEGEGRRIEVKGGRHPCVECMDNVLSFMPNDCQMVEEDSCFHIITGPNMGGKSTYIRALGCILLLAQVGCFVPCDLAVLSPIDGIFARVGAGDALQRGVSTFMAEMLDSAVILSCASPRSLLLVDELGRGTSTFDGYGLAFALSQHIRNTLGCFTLFATHFHEITALSRVCKGVVNRHVDAQVRPGAQGKGAELVVMLYKVKEGVCWQSFGVDVARTAKFPESLLEVAREKLRQLESSLQGTMMEEGGETGTDMRGRVDGDAGEGSEEAAQGTGRSLGRIGQLSFALFSPREGAGETEETS